MYKRYLPLALILAALNPHVARSQQEDTALGKFIATNGMILVPVSWQPYLGPGSVVYVGWEKRKFGRYKYLNKSLDAPNSDLSATLPDASATSVAVQEIKRSGIDISVALAKLSPEFMFGSGYQINNPQTKFGFKGYDQIGAFRALTGSPKTIEDLNFYSAPDANGHKMFKGYGQGYLVRQVFTVEELHITSVNTVNIAFGLKNLKAGTCLPATPLSELKKTAANGAGAGGAANGAGAGGAGNSEKPSNVVTTLQSSVPDIQVKVCRSGNATFDLSITPGIPIGMVVSEIQFDAQNKPTLNVLANMRDFRDAMKHPD